MKCLQLLHVQVLLPMPVELNGDLTVDDWGILTIYPANPGDKIRLEFIQFDIDWSDFWIYDGENTMATELGWWENDDYPGTVTASYQNTSGALTIHFVAQPWTPFDNVPGWAAIYLLPCTS